MQQEAQQPCHSVISPLQDIAHFMFFPLTIVTPMLKFQKSATLLLTTLTSGPNFCMIAAENAAPANNRC